MLLRVASDPDSEKALASVLLFETADRLHKFVGVVIAPRDRGEALLSRETVASQGQNIGYSHKLEVLKLELDLFGGQPSADEVGNHVDLEFGLDGSADGGLADAPADEPLPVASVWLFLVGHLIPVAGDVYVSGIELDERSYVIQ